LSATRVKFLQFLSSAFVDFCHAYNTRIDAITLKKLTKDLQKVLPF